MPADCWTYAFLCASAFIAGVMNSVAGGGTLLTFPALAALVPAAVANATSTVALLPGSFAGALGYRKELWECRRFVARMVGPSIVGGFVGAWLVGRNKELFDVLVPWLILTAAVLFVVQAALSIAAFVPVVARDGAATVDHVSLAVAAELAGVHPQTLRAYERLGLLSPQRTSGNTRRYSERDIERLRLIQELTQGEGINLAGVQMIMAMREQLDEIQRRAEDLERRLTAILDGSTSADIVPLRSVISFTWEDR